MPIQYPTEIELEGPWLIDDEALFQLEQILNDEWNKLKSRRKSLIEKEANEKLQKWQESELVRDKRSARKKLEEFIADPSYKLARSSWKTVLSLQNKGTYPTDKFASASRDDALTHEVVTGFSTDLESADIRCRVYTKNWSNALVVEVSPETADEAREIFVTLRNWAEKNSSPSWQRLWKKLSGTNWLIWFLLLILSLGFGLQQSQAQHQTRSKGQRICLIMVSRNKIP